MLKHEREEFGSIKDGRNAKQLKNFQAKSNALHEKKEGKKVEGKEHKHSWQGDSDKASKPYTFRPKNS